MVPVNPVFFLKIPWTGIIITKKGRDLPAPGPGSRSVTSLSVEETRPSVNILIKIYFLHTLKLTLNSLTRFSD